MSLSLQMPAERDIPEAFFGRGEDAGSGVGDQNVFGGGSASSSSTSGVRDSPSRDGSSRMWPARKSFGGMSKHLLVTRLDFSIWRQAGEYTPTKEETRLQNKITNSATTYGTAAGCLTYVGTGQLLRRHLGAKLTPGVKLLPAFVVGASTTFAALNVQWGQWILGVLSREVPMGSSWRSKVHEIYDAVSTIPEADLMSGPNKKVVEVKLVDIKFPWANQDKKQQSEFSEDAAGFDKVDEQSSSSDSTGFSDSSFEGDGGISSSGSKSGRTSAGTSSSSCSTQQDYDSFGGFGSSGAADSSSSRRQSNSWRLDAFDDSVRPSSARGGGGRSSTPRGGDLPAPPASQDRNSQGVRDDRSYRTWDDIRNGGPTAAGTQSPAYRSWDDIRQNA
ncbi:unnamed protein product [Amoebophrya sp. A25]|nr:unnamed protein product [Amoebophrya sp. A25]|eukprot:GSA25T00016589001.1